MRTLESFYKPGLESPQDIIAELGETPREVHAAGVLSSKVIRIVIVLVVLGGGAYIEYYLWQAFVERASVLAWTVGIALWPVVLGFVPWACVTSFRRRMAAYSRYARIYRDGIPTRGWVNTISRVSGSNFDCHYVEHSWSSTIAKVRLDYTFEVGDDIKIGTVIMHEQSARFLVPNMEICVLYLSDNITDNMIFPLPGSDWFVAKLH